MAKSPDKSADDPADKVDTKSPPPSAPEPDAAAASGALLPGKDPEPAAASGAEPEPTPGLAPPGQGAQVILTGDAQAAARGGTHGDIVQNTGARDAAIAAGHIEPATADAAQAATTGGIADEIDEAETAAIAKVKEDFAAQRAARAAKP